MSNPYLIISELGVLFCAEGDITTTSTSRPFQDAIKRSGYQNWTSMVVENTLALDYYVPQNIVPQKFNGIKKIGDREGTYKSTNLCLCQQHLCASKGPYIKQDRNRGGQKRLKKLSLLERSRWGGCVKKAQT